MPRLRQVPRAEVTAPVVTALYDMMFGDRDPVAEPGTASGTPGDWWTVFAAIPAIFDHSVRGFAIYRDPDRTLDPVLRELGQARAGWSAGSVFVFSQHCKSLRIAGVSEEKIAAVPVGPASPLFDDVERLVLAYADCLVLDHGRVPDALFEALRARLSEEEILELTYITSMYLMHAVMSRALRTEFDDLDDPVVEIPGPAGPAGEPEGATPP
jgi:alkylhydroperoxidase family enzyme